MSQPVTTQPILSEAIIRKVNHIAINEYGDLKSYQALRTGGKGSKEKNVFVLNVSKFCYVMAENCFVDINTIAQFNLARGMNTEQQESILFEFFLAIAVYMLLPDSDPISRLRLYGTESSALRKFWEEYVMERVEMYGGVKIAGIDIMCVLCKTIEAKSNTATLAESTQQNSNETAGAAPAESDVCDKFEFNQKKFVLETGSSIRSNGAKAKTEFNSFCTRFKKDYLDKDGQPKSGDTWDNALERFRCKLWQESTNADVQATAPGNWLPLGSHSWLLFVCFSPYGAQRWGTKLPPILGGQGPEIIDANKNKSRSAARKFEVLARTPVTESPSRVTASSEADIAFAAKARLDSANNEQKQHIAMLQTRADGFRRKIQDILQTMPFKSDDEKVIAKEKIRALEAKLEAAEDVVAAAVDSGLEELSKRPKVDIQATTTTS